jgi:hypothetical protein
MNFLYEFIDLLTKNPLDFIFPHSDNTFLVNQGWNQKEKGPGTQSSGAFLRFLSRRVPTGERR